MDDIYGDFDVGLSPLSFVSGIDDLLDESFITEDILHIDDYPFTLDWDELLSPKTSEHSPMVVEELNTPEKQNPMETQISSSNDSVGLLPLEYSAVDPEVSFQTPPRQKQIQDVSDIGPLPKASNLPPTPGSSINWDEVNNIKAKPIDEQSGQEAPIPTSIPTPSTSAARKNSKIGGLSDKKYSLTTTEGQQFEISFSQMQSIPWSHIRAGKRKRYTIFLGGGASVRLKLRKNKLVWQGFKIQKKCKS